MGVRIRQLAWLLLILVVGSACTGAPANQSPALAKQRPAQSGPLVTITVATMGDDAMDSLIAAFYEKHPNYRVETVAIPSEDEERFVRDKVTHGEWDVVSFYPFLAKESLLLDLGPSIQKSRFDLKPLGTAVEQLRWDGKLYDLPTAVYPHVLYYNKDLFRKAGVAPPKERWTWEQLRDTARQLSHGEGGERVWGLSAHNQVDLVYMWLTQRAGVPAWQADEQSIREGLQFFTTLIFSDKSLSQDVNPTSPEWRPRRDFHAGRAGLYLNLFVLNYMASQLSFEWDIAPLPTLAGEPPAVMVWPRTYAIPSSSRNAEAAWEFLRFITGPEGAVALAKIGQVPMYRTEAAQKAWFGRDPAPPSGTADLFETDWIIRPRNEESNQRQLEMLLARTIGHAVSGQKPWEEALTEYAERAAQIRQQGQP